MDYSPYRNGKIISAVPPMKRCVNRVLSSTDAWRLRQLGLLNAIQVTHPLVLRRLPRTLTDDVSQTIGALGALPFAPYVVDGFGRRSAILLGAVVMIIAATLQTASTSVQMFIGARWARIRILRDSSFPTEYV